MASGSDGTTPSLEDLIAQIDSETGQASVNSPGDIPPSSSVASEYGIDQFITFALQDILLALPLSSALEIGHRPMITPLFNLPDWVLGVSNIRGEVVSIVDLKTYFELPSPYFKKPLSFLSRQFELTIWVTLGNTLCFYTGTRRWLNQFTICLSHTGKKPGQ